MSTPILIERFYERIWHAADYAAIHELLDPDFAFRGSLGAELRGREAFEGYVRSVRGALADYHCEVMECVSEGDRAFARMRFSGRHVGVFQGHAATGKPVQWDAAALFHFNGPTIARLWVLGDLAGLEALLDANAR